MYIPHTKWTWSFMGLAVVQACIVLALEAYIFARFTHDVASDAPKSRVATAIVTFLALYIFGFIYSLMLVYDGLRAKNTIQVIGLVLLNLGLLVYGAVQLDTLNEGLTSLARTTQLQGDLWDVFRPYLIAIPCILGLTTVVMAFLAYKLYNEFAWTIYKHISADLRMKRRYLTYQIYIALLKFDFFFFLGFTIQFVVIVHGRTNAEFGVTIAAIPVTIIILFLAAFFTRREILVGCAAVVILFCGGFAYFVFKLYRMWEPGFRDEYLAARKELATFAVITILLIVITIVYQIMCMANFKQGLKQYVTSSSSSRDDEKVGTIGGSVDMHGRPMSYGYAGSNGFATGPGVEMTSDYGKPGHAPPQRMEID